MSAFTTTKNVIPATCPNCFKRFDDHASVSGDAKPAEGSISICIGCGHACVFQKDLTLRSITKQELVEIMQESPNTYLQIITAQAIINLRAMKN